jgi:hypothetical protein
VTYQEWCENAKTILAEADAYNAWAAEAKHYLLTDIGPRIAKLGQSGYVGCGFHYHLEQQFARLVDSLALPWQPCANHLDKIKDDSVETILTKVLYESLLESIVRAEANPITREDT